MQERTRRICMTICGVLICGFSVGMFNFSALGLDLFQGFLIVQWESLRYGSRMS